MAKIGLVDVDSVNFPNIPLMKLSAWHKARGDSVEWYSPMLSEHMDIVYKSKVFSNSPDFDWCIDADKIIEGGTGYAISTINGKEIYDKANDHSLPDEIEHIYPDYEIYGINDVAYGFLTRGCPRGCGFCHVSAKEGRCSRKVADLSEFWRDQKKIVLCDPNILGCKDHEELLEQITSTKADIDFNQGLDVRFITDDNLRLLSKIKMRELHLAWDRYEDKEQILPLLGKVRASLSIHPHRFVVYVLCNYDSNIGQDLERIYTLRDMGFAPYVMLYNKQDIPRGHDLMRLQRWVNNRYVFWRTERFEEYK